MKTYVYKDLNTDGSGSYNSHTGVTQDTPTGEWVSNLRYIVQWISVQQYKRLDY